MNWWMAEFTLELTDADGLVLEIAVRQCRRPRGAFGAGGLPLHVVAGLLVEHDTSFGVAHVGADVDIRGCGLPVGDDVEGAIVVAAGTLDEQALLPHE